MMTIRSIFVRSIGMSARWKASATEQSIPGLGDRGSANSKLQPCCRSCIERPPRRRTRRQPDGPVAEW